MVTMNQIAIVSPSGRSMMLIDRRVDEHRDHHAKRNAPPRRRDRRGERDRGHQDQDASGVGTGLLIDVRVEEPGS